jgi:hypothetical protein
MRPPNGADTFRPSASRGQRIYVPGHMCLLRLWNDVRRCCEEMV